MLIMKKKTSNSTMFTNQERAADATEANTRAIPTKISLKMCDSHFSRWVLLSYFPMKTSCIWVNWLSLPDKGDKRKTASPTTWLRQKQ